MNANMMGTGIPGKRLWSPADTKARYLSNMKNRLFEMRDFGWEDSEDRILYDCGEHGFRETRLSSIKQNQCLALGCSYTFGVGLPLEDIWTSIFEQKYAETVYNLGAPSMGNETFFRLAYHWIPILKPKLVMVLSPGMHRRERISDNRWKPLGGWCDINDAIDMQYLDKDECFYSNTRSLLGIEMLCQQHNATYLVQDSQFYWGKTLARDLMHPGKDYHLKTAEYFYEQTLSTQAQIL